MATAEEYAQWIVNNSDKRGTPEFETVAKAYKDSMSTKPPEQTNSHGKESWLDEVKGGLASGPINAYLGAKQMFGGLSPEEQKILQYNKEAEAKAPVSSVVGNVAMLAPTMLIPGVNTMAGAAITGAATGAAQPVEGEQSFANIAKQKALGAVLGGATGAAGQAGANYIGQKMANKAAELAIKKSQRAPIDQTIQAAQEAGFVIPPGQVNPSLKNRILESMSGKEATQQVFSNRNQAVADALARKAAGLSDDMPITSPTLKQARGVASKPYQEASDLLGDDAIEAMKTAKADANLMWNMQNRNPHPETLAKAREASARSAQMEDMIDSALSSAGRSDLSAALKEARKKIAVNHAVEDAMVEGGGTVDARTIARMAQRGEPLSDELRVIGDFANNFPKIAQPHKAYGTPDAHNLKAMASILAGGGGMAAAGPAGIAAAALPWSMSLGARKYLTSNAAQKALIPSYELGMTEKLAKALADSGIIAPLAISSGLAAQ